MIRNIFKSKCIQSLFILSNGRVYDIVISFHRSFYNRQNLNILIFFSCIILANYSDTQLRRNSKHFKRTIIRLRLYDSRSGYKIFSLKTQAITTSIKLRIEITTKARRRVFYKDINQLQRGDCLGKRVVTHAASAGE
ncbi:hypothetical protein SAMN05216597_0010 [Pseudomonas cannabina]|nr:hypothetical protein SAMN05216597_0010 [Pseudomonas cannabina]